MLIVGAYFVFCLVYALIWNYKHTSPQEAFCRFVFVLFIPVISFVLFAVIDNPKLHNKEEDLDRYFIGDEERSVDLLYLRPVDKEAELNKVSMEEALSINDYSVRRKAVMDTLKYNTLDYLDSLKKALSNEDTETSHYATAVIMDLQSKLSDSISQIRSKYNEDKKDKNNIREYEKMLEKLIFSGVFDERNLTRYNADYKNLSDTIFKEQDIEEIYYINRIKFDFKTSDFTNAYETCSRYKIAYPESEDMVICNIKYCVMTYDRDKLEAFFTELKSLPVKLSQKSLQYIRFLTV